MRERLADQLLATVMGWDERDIAQERPLLQAFADYKYDDYEQFQPGMRFMESLSRWLYQFPTMTERHAAYAFFQSKLVFVSRPELQHLVSTVYPDIVKRRLIDRAAHDLGVPPHLVGRVARDPAYALRHRTCLFVGLSDGARTDVLRRANPQISNEQVVADYSSLSVKATDLIKDLQEDLRDTTSAEVAKTARFSTVVLLDDFSASGISYLREGGKGKIARTATALAALPDLVDVDDLNVIVVLYIATAGALAHLRTAATTLEAQTGGRWTVEVVQELSADLVIKRGEDSELLGLIEAIYDPVINDTHMAKGGTDGKYGFADCGLPIVLAHNTPNNSIAPLWADTSKAQGLFPRVTRHREER